MAGKCGDCNLCCKLFTIPSFKNNFDICQHYSLKEKNCSIYKDRCNTCKNYSCLWLIGYLPDLLKPDKVGVVFDRFWLDKKKLYMVGFVDGEITQEANRIFWAFVASNMALVVMRREGLFLYNSTINVGDEHIHFAKNSGRIFPAPPVFLARHPT